ncbi:MAG: hypothetical protein M3154_10030 [Candidatus Eremiobacteraeota bacterium]|nr:hypothetical protein [Candidatus Eremiobacteraeota bacterium]
MTGGIRRALTISGVLTATVLAAWWTWPRPELELEVARGGIGSVVDHFGRRDSLPDTLYLQTRGHETTVRVVNHDTASTTLGIFSAGPGEMRDFTIATPGVYGGYCSAHPTRRRLTYVVR